MQVFQNLKNEKYEILLALRISDKGYTTVNNNLLKVKNDKIFHKVSWWKKQINKVKKIRNWVTLVFSNSDY